MVFIHTFFFDIPQIQIMIYHGKNCEKSWFDEKRQTYITNKKVFILLTIFNLFE